MIITCLKIKTIKKNLRVTLGDFDLRVAALRGVADIIKEAASAVENTIFF